MAPAYSKDRAHELIELMAPVQVAAVVGLLEAMLDLVEPLSQTLAKAPVEEEELSPETAAALGRARASLARGEGVPHETILAEFGL